MKEVKKIKTHSYKRGCNCNDCNRQLEEVTLINKANLWFRSQMESMKQTVKRFAVVDTKVQPAVKKRISRKRKA